MTARYKELIVITFACHSAVVLTPMLTICGEVSMLRDLVLVVEPLTAAYFGFGLLKGVTGEEGRKMIRRSNLVAIVAVIGVWAVDLALRSCMRMGWSS